MTYFKLAADARHIFVGHLETLVEELADDPASAHTTERTPDQGEVACGYRRQQPQGYTDPQASLSLPAQAFPPA